MQRMWIIQVHKLCLHLDRILETYENFEIARWKSITFDGLFPPLRELVLIACRFCR